MVYSIQEYAEKINSRLSYADVLGACFSCLICLILSLYIAHAETGNTPIYYQAGGQTLSSISSKALTNKSTLPFASRSGKTYTFSWCSGASRIKEKNKIFFESETEAKKTGRTLSKLCK